VGVQSKKEFILLLGHLFPPLSPFSLLHEPKPEFLIEVTSRMKSLEGLEVDLSQDLEIEKPPKPPGAFQSLGATLFLMAFVTVGLIICLKRFFSVMASTAAFASIHVGHCEAWAFFHRVNLCVAVGTF